MAMSMMSMKSSIAGTSVVQRASNARAARTSFICRANENQFGVKTNKATGSGDSYSKIEQQRNDSSSPPDGGKPVSERNTESDEVLLSLAEKEKQFSAEKLGIKQEVAMADAMRFKGALPETINGRAAMLGVLAAVGAEAATGRNIVEQIQTAPLWVAATFLTIIVASVVPVVKGTKRETSNLLGKWTPEAETLNGRIAMLGFVALIATNLASRGSV